MEVIYITLHFSRHLRYANTTRSVLCPIQQECLTAQIPYCSDAKLLHTYTHTDGGTYRTARHYIPAWPTGKWRDIKISYGEIHRSLN